MLIQLIWNVQNCSRHREKDYGNHHGFPDSLHDHYLPYFLALVLIDYLQSLMREESRSGVMKGKKNWGEIRFSRARLNCLLRVRPVVETHAIHTSMGVKTRWTPAVGGILTALESPDHHIALFSPFITLQSWQPAKSAFQSCCSSP